MNIAPAAYVGELQSSLSERRPATPTNRRRVVLIAACVLAGSIAAVVKFSGAAAAMGGELEGTRLERARHSANFADGHFHNPVPDTKQSSQGSRDMLKRWLFGHEQRVPPGDIPVVARHASDYATPPATGLRITVIGHATTLVEIDGHRVLTDPVWSERVSPFAWLGPKRFHAPPISLTELPAIDAVVISHDHYDHLDMHTIQALATRGTHFLVPLGVGAHLEVWGVPPTQLSELDWGEQAEVAGLKIVATPARHYSGRNPFRKNETLWASWVVQGPSHRVFFSGDSGYFDEFERIGAKYGPFDATLIKVGASDPTWSNIHMTPEEAVQTHVDLQGRVLVPVHWGTFNLAFHPWSEPADRVVAAAKAAGVTVLVPRPGEFVEPQQPRPVESWWNSVR